MVSGCFVTGTDTEIGKTWASRALLLALADRGVRTAAMKPVASGCAMTAAGLRSDDAVALRADAAVSSPYERVNPYAFEPAIAPHLAAEEASIAVRFDTVLDCLCQLRQDADFVVVEGVGGWRVPLGEDGDLADLCKALALPIVLVVGLRLGCINHALLTAESTVSMGLPLAGWIATRIDPAMARAEKNLQTLRARLPAPCLGVLPHAHEFDAEAFSAAVDPTPLLDPALLEPGCDG